LVRFNFFQPPRLRQPYIGRMSITPYLYYEDVAAAMAWLSKAFGFKRLGRPMKGPDGRITHAAMKLGADVVMMGAPGGKYKNPRRLGQTTQCLYVTVDDADKHFARAKKSGGTILQEPSDTEYGARRYGMADPEGHEWYFAHERSRPR
jgi:PhnB protein